MQASKHSKSVDGWAKVGIQLPDAIADRFKELASEAGLGGSKFLITTAVSILIAMPEADRDALVRYVMQKTYKRPEGLQPEELLDFLKFIMRAREAEPTKNDPKWEVMYIVDPELTPQPGQKASDRERKSREERA
jgi:hypothetical protein